MTKVVKRRLKIKWKNFIIFIIIVVLLIFIVIKGLLFTITTIKNSLNKKEEVKTVEKIKPKKEDNELKRKYGLLDNVNDRITYFHDDYIDRYIKYKEENPNLDIEKVIINVNIGLDKEVYEEAEKAINLNKTDILVNKYNYLEEDYVPNNLEKINTQYALSNMKLVSVAKEAYEKMAKDASKDKRKLVVMSGYRDYNYQVNLYNRYAKKDGKEKADTYSGRPGFSEHQTGLAIDLYNGKIVYTRFEETKEFTWMKDNAYKYGFILRFPKGKELETGYQYESWHYRYVGIDIAKEINEKNISLEEYIAMQ